MTSIGQAVTITGDVTSDEDLLVDGTVRGSIAVRDGALTLGNQAKVKGDLRGAKVTVLGNLRGSINATARIELGVGSVVEGNLSADRIVIADGARFNGRIDMGQRTIAAKIAQYKATQAG